VLFGLVFAYSGAALYALRKMLDRRAQGLTTIGGSLHLKLTGAMLAVLVMDGAGYLLAVSSLPHHNQQLVTMLEDIFVAVAMLTISVGLVLPGTIAHSAVEVSKAASQLARGTAADFTRAMRALGQGKLDEAHAHVDVTPVRVHSRDELGEMAASFNALQNEIAEAAAGLDSACNGLRSARADLTQVNIRLEQRVLELDHALEQKRRAEEGLTAATNAAQSANQAKSRFLANMSHEIRTPINGVLGMTDLLLATQLSDEQRRYAETAKLSGNALLTLIDDILDFSKIEAGKLQIETVDFDLHAAIAGIVDMLRPSATAKELPLNVSLAKDVPVWVTGDPLRLRQVLTNLLSNAIKFTERGNVSLVIESTHGGANRPADVTGVQFEIIDTGIGISEEAQARLFSPFTQADNSTTRQFGGTGLGLAITKQLITLMGGQISLSSVPRLGSKFAFVLPWKSAAGARDGATDSADRQLPLLVGHILLAEDNAINQQVAIAKLRSLGCTVEAVANGREAVQAARSKAYDLVLMDCHMPDVDGFAATELIRREKIGVANGRHVELPIIALTANAMEGDRIRCLAAGMNDYMTKPFTTGQIHAVLARWLAPTSPVEESIRSAAAVDVNVLKGLGALQQSGEEDLVARIIALYIQDTPRLIAVIERGAETGDTNAVAMAAHSLKSSSETVGATEMSRICGVIEQSARGASSAANLIGITELHIEYQRSELALVKYLQTRSPIIEAAQSAGRVVNSR
jgi:two-component system, sensor histidine kinase